MNACRDCKGFVIDVRGNPGGIGGLAMGVAGWFIDQSDVRLGTEYLRGLTMKFVIFPRPEPFRVHSRSWWTGARHRLRRFSPAD